MITISFVCCIQYAFAYDYSTIPANTWVHMAPTGGPPPAGIDAYSGMAYDASGSRLILFGGGHNDYRQNDAWVYDITNNNWSRPYAPDPDPNTILNCGCYPAAYPGSIDYSGQLRPLARHTYNNIEMMFDTNGNPKMFVTGTYGPLAGTPNLPYSVGNDTWAYLPNNSSWQHLGTHPGHGEGSATYVPHGTVNGGKVYTITKANVSGGQTRPQVHAYDVDSGNWSTVTTTGMADGIPYKDHSAAYDSVGHAIYIFSGETFIGGTRYVTSNQLWRLNLNNMQWQKINPIGNPPPAEKGQGLVYDSINNVLIVAYVGSGSVRTYIYEIATNTWKEMTASAGGVQPSVNSGVRVYGRFRYDPTNNVAFLVTRPGSSTVDVWAYRYQEGNPDTTPPSLPSNLTANAASDKEIGLTWSGSSDAESGVASYRIYRSQGNNANNAVFIGSINHQNSDPQSFTDTSGLSANTQYTYKVTAVNLSGYENAGATVTVNTLADTLAPTLLTVNANIDPNSVTLTFSEDIDAVSGNATGNYTISNGITVSNAVTDGNRVTLTTSTLSEGINYSVTINNLTDTANPANTISPNTSTTFNFVTSLQLSPPVTGSNYSWASMSNGATVYTDIGGTYSNISGKFINHQLLQTANGDSQGNTSVIFTSNMNVTVFLGHYQDGINNVPAWMRDNGWVQTNDTWNTSNRTLYVYTKNYPAGNITLYENGGANGSHMYTAVVVPQESVGFTIKQTNGGNTNPILNSRNTISTGAGAIGIADLLFLVSLGLSLFLYRQRS